MHVDERARAGHLERARESQAFSAGTAKLTPTPTNLVELIGESHEVRGPVVAGGLERVLELLESGIPALDLQRRRRRCETNGSVQMILGCRNQTRRVPEANIIIVQMDKKGYRR